MYSGENTTLLCDFNSEGYRLPTEVEWEYAARGGEKSLGYRYSGSNNLYESGWYISNSKKSTQPVRKKRPNELGIYDMSGNVWEWCWDQRVVNKTSNLSDPGSRSSGSHLIRGGSWADVKEYCEVTKGYCLTADFRYYGLGFRVVKTKK